VAYLDYLDCQRASRSLAMAGFVFTGGILGEPGVPEYVESREITPELFSVLGVPLFRGRAFTSEEDRPGGAPVIILSYSLCQRRFGVDTRTIGLSLVLDTKSYTVVGITPQRIQLDG